MERAVELPSGQHVCLGCGQVLDKVVASFAVLDWDAVSGDYSKLTDVGDFACPYCGEVVSVTKFYPPEEQQEKPSRPYPQTYGDWVSLAEDIKDKLGDDVEARMKVNMQLGYIAADVDNSDSAKRWLAAKAIELGIA